MGVSDPRDPHAKTADAVDEHGLTLPTQAEPPPARTLPPSSETGSRGEHLPRIGRYVLLRELGRGGMGVVYAAYDEELDRKVALKLLHPSRQGDSQFRARILREAQALARVSSPHVVQVFQVGEFEGLVYIAMEFVNGTTLTRWQSEPGRRWRDILHMYLAVGEGVLSVHEAELVHRDFKPDNVLIGKDERPRVADFGLARLEGKSGAGLAVASLQLAESGAAVAETPTSITQTGVAMGTPLYMSPEQHQGKPADSRSDQFSFCVALYEALYQQLPFAGTTMEKLALNVILGRVLPRPAGSHVPTPVHDALLRGLARSPEQRFPSMHELLAALTFDPSVDRAAGPGSRRKVTLSMIALSLTATLGIKLLELLKVGAMAGSVITALVYFGVFVFLAVRFRREMRNNIFHRGTAVYGLVFSGQILFLRVLGSLLGLTHTQLVTIDLASLAGASCMMTSLIMPSLWPLVPLNLLGALAAALLPAYASTICSLGIAVTLSWATVRWNRMVKTRRPRTRTQAQVEQATKRD